MSELEGARKRLAAVPIEFENDYSVTAHDVRAMMTPAPGQLDDREIGTVSKGVDAGLEMVHSRTSDIRRRAHLRPGMTAGWGPTSAGERKNEREDRDGDLRTAQHPHT